MRNREEHKTQSNCVKWFKLKYPRYKKLLFSIPNGGTRHKLEAISLKREGLERGVADLFLSIPNKGYSGFYIEMKSSKGSLSKDQKEFAKAVMSVGYKYKVIRDFDTFVKEVTEYLM